jgi:hypothetical protein
VRREILWTHIRFGLNNPPDAPRNAVVVDQMCADEFARNEESVLAGVKGAGKLSGHVA